MDILTTIGLVFIGLLLADLVTACVHWVVDNYANPAWPVIGPHYVEFAHNHHEDPMELLRLPFVRVHWFIVSFAVFWTTILWLFAGLNLVTMSALVFGACTNLIHQWSHRTPEENGWLINFCHRMGVLQSPKHHDHHHNDEGASYALLTDYVNPLLEASAVFVIAEKCLEKIGIRKFWWKQESSHQSGIAKDQ